MFYLELSLKGVEELLEKKNSGKEITEEEEQAVVKYIRFKTRWIEKQEKRIEKLKDDLKKTYGVAHVLGIEKIEVNV